MSIPRCEYSVSKAESSGNNIRDMDLRFGMEFSLGLYLRMPNSKVFSYFCESIGKNKVQKILAT